MLHHLLELRKRIVYTLVFFLLLFSICFVYSSELLTGILLPLLSALPVSDHLIATNITSPLFTPIKISMNAALLLSIPVFLYNLWRFASPGLYVHEKRFFLLICMLSLLLFICGMLFCFFAVLPWIFELTSHSLPTGVHFFPDLGQAYDFIIHMLLVFGLCFQVPVVCVVLIRLNIISLDKLTMLRPYMIVLAFTLGMLLTPPDVLSQVMLAVPLWILFEVGILCSLLVKK